MTKLVRLSLALLIILLAYPQLTPSQHSPQSAQALIPTGPKIGNGVDETLERMGSAQVIISLRDPAGLSAADGVRLSAVSEAQHSLLERLGGDLAVSRRYRHIPGLSGKLTKAGLSRLRQLPEVASIMLDERTQAHVQEGQANQGISQVRSQYGLTGAGVTVAVLDSGIDTDHPDFSGNLIGQHCFSTGSTCLPSNTTESNSAEDGNGHGTNVSGIIAGKGGIASPGYAPAAKLVAVRVLSADGSGWMSDWVAGLDWVRTNLSTYNVKIVNMSLGTFTVYPGNCDADQPAAANAVAQLRALGVTIFASSGNQGSSTGIAAPACLSGVIAVGATYDSAQGIQPPSGTYQSLFGSNWPACNDSVTNAQTITCFTNSNAMLDLLAPGAWVSSTGVGGTVSTFAGTSQASPSAAGIAALLLQARSSLTPQQIEDTLKSTGTTVTDPKNGRQFKLVNALSAVQSIATSNTATPTRTRTPTNSGGYPEWSPNSVSYSVGTIVLYQNTLYRCRQNHTSQPGWDPVSVGSLWELAPNQPTATRTRTNTGTSASPTRTRTNTGTSASPTRTRTNTGTSASPTRTRTRTPTGPTATRTRTRTNTAPVASPTPTRTSTASLASPTPTRTNTAFVASPTPTRTNSPTPTQSSGTPAWTIGVSYGVGSRVSYSGLIYECIQPHTAQAGWEPPNVPALWRKL